jgi:type IV pilus assembly protein PilW
MPRRVTGFTLVELLVALGISSLVIAWLFGVLSAALNTLRTRDALADLQERGRYALASIESDLQMAGYFGLSHAGSSFRFLISGDPAAAVPAAQLRQQQAPAPGVPAGAQSCGDNYAVDLSVPIQGDNNRFMLGPHRSPACNARGGARSGADTLTVRRAVSSTTVPEVGRLQLLVDRYDAQRRFVLADGILPVGLVPSPDQLQLHDLQLNSYYIANDSDGRAGWPALRVKTLTRVGVNPTFVDTELMSGIEDLQLQFQTDGGYADPGQLPPGAVVRAVRVWLRIGAAAAEPGFVDARRYHYADVDFTPTGAERGQRRLLVSRTIALRNAPLD